MDDTVRSASRITILLFIAQSLVSAGTIAFGTVNTIVGAELSGRPGWAGVPVAVYLVAGALASFVWGAVMDRTGWRVGLSIALVLGVLGGALAFSAIQAGSFVLFLGGLVLTGATYSAMNLGRFAAAGVHPPESRAKAISNVVLGGTFGAVFGPLLVGPAGRWANGIGANELSGAYAAGAVLFAIAAVTVFTRLRPDPVVLGRQVSQMYPEAAPKDGKIRTIAQILRQPAVGLAVLVMVTGQLVMVFLMVISSLYMRANEHGLGSISLVLSSHTFGMFAFSVLSGRMADRFGRGAVMVTGAATLVLACLAAPLSTQVLPLAVVLFLIGLGWNFCYIGGSALLADQLSSAERSRTQGVNDLLVGMVSALGGVSSGLIYTSLGFGTIAAVGVAISTLLMAIILLWMRGGEKLAAGRPV